MVFYIQQNEREEKGNGILQIRANVTKQKNWKYQSSILR